MKGVPVSLPAQASLTRTPHVGFDSSTIKICLLVFAGYYLGAKLGFALTFHPHPISVLWPPNAILLAALLLTPVRIWWLALLAAFPAHLATQLQSDVPPRMIFCWFISNSGEALISAACTRFGRCRNVGYHFLRDDLVNAISDFGDFPFKFWCTSQ